MFRQTEMQGGASQKVKDSYIPSVQFLLAKFPGVLGLFLSTPILVMIMVLVKNLNV